MGAAESKPEEQGTNNNQEGGTGSNNNGSSPSSGGSTALAVGAAVGTALLGVAWGVSRYRSKDSDERVEEAEDHYLHANSFNTMSVANSHERIGDHYVLEGIKPKRVANYSNYSHFHERKSTLKILSYNVCSREHYGAIQVRMEAIGDLVQHHSPHFICFQEITPVIYNIFQGSSWWNDYYCSMSTEEASNKQYFCILADQFTKIAGTNKSLVVATSHLKSRNFNPNDLKSQYHPFKKQRSDQAKEALAILRNYPNVIFGGDMNWDEKMDGEFPLPEGWVDAWTELMGDEVGNTFDTRSNKMLNGHWPVQMRFDRILCKLKGFELDDIEIIGKEPIPDAFYQWNNKVLPVLPSDHYGLLLTMCT